MRDGTRARFIRERRRTGKPWRGEWERERARAEREQRPRGPAEQAVARSGGGRELPVYAQGEVGILQGRGFSSEIDFV